MQHQSVRTGAHDVLTDRSDGLPAVASPESVEGLAERSAVHRPQLLAGLCAAVVLVALAVFLQSDLGSDLAQHVGNAAQLLAATAACWGCVRASRRGGAEARGWALLAVGAGMWAGAAVLWAHYGLTRDHVYPFPSVADIGFVGYALPIAAGLVALSGHASRRVSGVRALLDGLVITSGVLFVSGVTVLGPLVAAQAPALTKLTGLAYPVVDVATVSLVLILGLRQPAGRRLLWVLLGGGLIILAICDSHYVALTSAGLQSIGTPVQAGWAAAWVLIALASLDPVRAAPGGPRAHFSVAQELLPYLPVLLAVLVLVRVDPARMREPLLAWSGLLLLGGLIVQQVLVAFEKVTLAADLEATVLLRGQQLSEVEERFGSLVASSADAIVGKTVDGVVTSWNPAAERLYGYRAEEVLGRPDTVLVPSDRLDEEAAILAAGARGERHRYETERLRKDGEVLSVSLTVSPIVVGNQVQGISVIGHDITQRKRHEAALQAQQLRTRAIIDTASDPFIALDDVGVVTDWNRAAEETFGWRREEVVGRLLAGTIVPERYREAHQQGLARIGAGGAAHVLGTRVEIEALHRNGTELQVELSIWRAGEAAGDGFNAFLHDITARKKAEQELASARDQAFEGSRAKSEFLATMSHEIRTPMNGVIGLCGLLLDTPLDDVQRRYADGVRGSGEALLAIIDDILDFSKLDAGKVELEQVAFDPRQVVDEVGLLLAATASAQGLELVASCAPDVPSALRGDPGRLRQILLNLGSNAVKFTASGEVVLRVGLVHPNQAGSDGTEIRFSVTDTGIGIAPAAQSRLFQPFSQADASTTRRYGGTGLGLVICQRLVQAMGGSLDLDSTEGQGSTFSFTVRLPTCSGDPAPVPGGPELPCGPRVPVVDDDELATPGGGATAGPDAPGRPRVPQPRRSRGRVLVVEDNEVNQLVAVGNLHTLGFSCEVAADGEQALTALGTSDFDLVLMDCHMPGTDGFQATAELRRREEVGQQDGRRNGGRRRTPVIAMTAGILPEDRQRCRSAGMDDFVGKPVDVDVLEQAIRRQLGGRTTAGVADSGPPGAPCAEPDVLDPRRLAVLGQLDPGGVAGLVSTVVQAFVAAAPERMSAVREAADAQLPEALEQVAHQLRGSAANLGANRVAAVCDQIEALAHAGSLPEAALLTELRVELELVSSALSRTVAS